MPDTIDKQIRFALKAMIIEIDASAEVYPYNALSHDVDQWANLFSSSAVKHGWVINRKGFSSEWYKATESKDVFQYELWGFYGFRSENEDDNSDSEWSAILDQFRDKLKASPRLGLSGVDEHKLLQLPNGGIEATIRSGNTQLHFAPCGLAVAICC